MNLKSKTGILLLNLGTPDDPSPEAVGRYLTEFLNDPWVIDIPTPLRWVLVNWLIVPKRKFASSEAYQQIWGKLGSPLKSALLEATEFLRRELGDAYVVEPAMRYQNPSIETALKRFLSAGVNQIRVVHLYPQYAAATNRSTEEKIKETMTSLGYGASVEILKPYYRNPLFIRPYVNAIREGLNAWERPDLRPYVLFSYHGLPERQIRKTDPSKTHCLVDRSCCDEITPKNEAFCYRAHCFSTTRELARELGLAPDQYSMSFQSRLGRAKWLDPDTVPVVSGLAQRGVKDLLVVCPAFTADCLETLEEIGIRLKEQFLSEGGERFDFVRSLNARPEWVSSLAEFSRSGDYSPLN